MILFVRWSKTVNGLSHVWGIISHFKRELCRLLPTFSNPMTVEFIIQWNSCCIGRLCSACNVLTFFGRLFFTKFFKSKGFTTLEYQDYLFQVLKGRNWMATFKTSISFKKKKATKRIIQKISFRAKAEISTYVIKWWHRSHAEVRSRPLSNDVYSAKLSMFVNGQHIVSVRNIE